MGEGHPGRDHSHHERMFHYDINIQETCFQEICFILFIICLYVYKCLFDRKTYKLDTRDYKIQEFVFIQNTGSNHTIGSEVLS